MKSTNSHFPSFWVKVFPIILMFLCIGLASTQAQNYKPFDEAVRAVDIALEELKLNNTGSSPKVNSGGQSSTIAGAPTQSNAGVLKAFEVSYFEIFLEKAKSTLSIAEAVTALDAVFPTQGLPQSRFTILTSAKADLMDLVAY